MAAGVAGMPFNDPMNRKRTLQRATLMEGFQERDDFGKAAVKRRSIQMNAVDELGDQGANLRESANCWRPDPQVRRTLRGFNLTFRD